MMWRLDGSQPVETLTQQIQSAAYATGDGDSWLKFGAFKITMDGGMTIGTAYQRIPYGEFGEQLYGQTNKDDRGQLFVTQQKLEQIFAAARNRGWQLTAHCQGGGAIDTFLNVLETLSLGQSRLHLMHASFQSPEAIARVRRLGVDANIQMPWLYHDAPALSRVFGENGMRYFIPLKSYLDAGVKIAAGSDHMIGHDKNRAVNPYNPFTSMWTAVTRKTSQGATVRPEQHISRQDALRMHTIWAAWMQHADHERGSIEPGKPADLVVIDRDYLTTPEDEIRRIEPQITIVNGRLIRGEE